MISREDIQHLANLARLKVAKEEVDAYRADLTAILGYVDKLKELDTEGIPEMAHADASVNAWRADEPKECPADAQSAMREAFPDRTGTLLSVPAVFDRRAEQDHDDAL